MTKPQGVLNSDCDHESLSQILQQGVEAQSINEASIEQPISPTRSSDNVTLDKVIPNGNHHLDDGVESLTDENDDNYDEPLGYQNFLCDINFEYSPGGNRSSPLGNKYCFKMKWLPYMVVSNRDDCGRSNQSISDNSSDITNNDCDIEFSSNLSGDHKLDLLTSSNYSSNLNPIDVTRETCAFLGNSDYVPSAKFRNRKVSLELVSAKLSQSNGYNMPPNTSLSNLTTLIENPPPPPPPPTSSSHTDSSSLSSYNSHSSVGITGHHQDLRATTLTGSKITPPPPPSSPSSSKKFVKYTILIRTIPGLDKHPAVIERRFSDFLSLYQGLSSQRSYSNIVKKFVTFPKKVYMGNFTLEKIAERSIEFTRLLDVCMSNVNLLWSVPFVSFLIDKELKEAHRLSLFGDPDDVQALIENAYYIEQKLYFKLEPNLRSSNSSSSLNSSSTSTLHNSSLPNGRSSSSSSTSTSTSNQSQINYAISVEGNNDNNSTNHNAHETTSKRPNNGTTSSGSPCSEKSNLTPINQRILVTFCMLFITYCRSHNYRDLRLAVGEFSLLISSQEYIDSLIDTRHYNSLRACLVFLMNLNHGNVVDDKLRLLLKRKLEDIDGSYAELNECGVQNGRPGDTKNDGATNSPSRGRRFSLRDSLGGDSQGSPLAGRTPTSRVTKKDLTSLLRDRNFCSFQDDSRMSR